MTEIKKIIKKDVPKKTTAQIVKERIDHALNMLNNNMSKQDIRTSSIKKFNVTEKQVDVYIAEAEKLIEPKKKEIKQSDKTLNDVESDSTLIKVEENNVIDSIEFDAEKFETIWNELNPNHQCFVLEYIKNKFNGGQAYAEAYNKSKINDSCYVSSVKLLRNVKIQQSIAYKIKLKLNDAGLSIEWVLKKLKIIVDRCLQEVKPIMFYNKETKQYEETGEFQFNTAGANKALDSIGNYFNMFKLNLDISGKIEHEVKTDLSKLSNDEVEQLIKLKEKCENG